VLGRTVMIRKNHSISTKHATSPSSASAKLQGKRLSDFRQVQIGAAFIGALPALILSILLPERSEFITLPHMLFFVCQMPLAAFLKFTSWEFPPGSTIITVSCIMLSDAIVSACVVSLLWLFMKWFFEKTFVRS
jgi:hypothetical protein